MPVTNPPIQPKPKPGARALTEAEKASTKLQLRPGSAGKDPSQLTRNDYYVPGKGKLSPGDIRAQQNQGPVPTDQGPKPIDPIIKPPQTDIERTIRDRSNMGMTANVGGLIRQQPNPPASKAFGGVVESAKKAMAGNSSLTQRKAIKQARSQRRTGGM